VLREAESQLAAVAEVLRGDPAFLRAFEVPSVTPTSKRSLITAVAKAADLRGVTYKRAERDHLANMLGHLTRDPALLALVPEGAPGVERLRLSLS
jgi:hypothetical protein